MEAADAHVAIGRHDGEEAEGGGEGVVIGQVVLVRAAGAGEDDFPGGLAVLALHAAGKIEGGLDVQGAGGGLGLEDGLFGGAAVGFKDRGGGGESVGTDDHDAVR